MPGTYGKERKRYMDKQLINVKMKKILIVLVVFLGIILTVLGNSYRIAKEMTKQLYQNLEDVANQNALALHNTVHGNYLLLEGLSDNLRGATPEDIEERLDTLNGFVGEYGLKRFAICFPDGTCYSTDQEVSNLAFREFFKRGMEGKGTITGVLFDALSDDHGMINVMTIPIYDESGNVESVFGMTYNTKDFNEALQVESFDGQGYSCAINTDGQIIANFGNDRLELSKNLFDDILAKDPSNSRVIENIKRHIGEGKQGAGTMYLPEKTYFCCVPIQLLKGDETWYLVTAVPAKVLDERTAPILDTLYLMGALVVILILIGVWVVIYLSKEQRNIVLKIAYEDVLTGGANFPKFLSDMQKRRIEKGYMVAMDLTNFNNINIAAGKNAGDQALIGLWDILDMEVQSGEYAGHVGEDLFIMFLQAPERELLVERLRRISEEVNANAKALQIQGIHARYGIYYLDKKESVEEAYSKAQIARKYVKTSKDQWFAFYDEMDHEKRKQLQRYEERFEEAMDAEEFEIWFQPKYSTSTGEIVGSEALVRWREQDGSLIPPGSFIPLFEQNGMIVRLDEYVFRQVCKHQAKWLREGRKVLPASINLSRASLYYSDIVDRYRMILEEFRLEAKYIQIEVTESAIEGKTDIRVLLEEFRSIGVQILMDDFGTGFSSLATLNMRCFDTLKLDKSLIDHIGDKNGETLLYYVINMGRQLGLHITAEGVENQMQLNYLQELQCDDIQGYLFAKPMPLDEFEKKL